MDIIARDGRPEIVPASTPIRLVDEGEGVVAVAEVEMLDGQGADEIPPLTADLVRDTLEQVRR